jgi:hypothetical protein
MAIDTICRQSRRSFEIRVIVSGSSSRRSPYRKPLPCFFENKLPKPGLSIAFAAVAAAGDFRDVPSSSPVITALA